MLCVGCNQVIFLDSFGDWVDITNGDGCLQDSPETDTHFPDRPASEGLEYTLSLVLSRSLILNKRLMSNPIGIVNVDKQLIVDEMISYLNTTPLDDLRFGIDTIDLNACSLQCECSNH